MTYELAEKLYKARFPGIKCSEENPTPGYNYPSLSELIQACMFFRTDSAHIEFTFYPNVNPPYAYQAIIWFPPREFTERIVSDSGSTLEEAAANLWLKLNEKNL